MLSDDLLLSLQRKGVSLKVSGHPGDYTLWVQTNRGTRSIPFTSFQTLSGALDRVLSDRPLSLVPPINDMQPAVANA